MITLLQIGTIVGCNARCKMCGCRVMIRQTGTMPLELFKKVIDDSVEMNIKTFCPFIQGEPLLDKEMIPRLRYIRTVVPDANIAWFTNGLLLTRVTIDELAEVGVRQFAVSIHGGNKDVYERNTECSWERAIANLELLIAENQKLGNPFEIRPIMCDFSLTHDSIPDFKKLCEKYNLHPHICGFSNFGGLIKDDIGEEPFRNLPYKLCHRSQHHIYVLINGDVGVCCFDVNGVNIMGNVTQTSLKQIWTSNLYQTFRQMHRDGRYKEIPVCKDCNSNRFNG